MSREIGSKIKHLRKSRKLTQQELSNKLDIKRSTISNYEIGRRTPHLKDLQTIASAFGVGLDYFGIQKTDEVFDVLARAKEVFQSQDVSPHEKEQLYMEFMKMFLELKGNEQE